MTRDDLAQLIGTEIFDIAMAAAYLGIQMDSLEAAASRSRIEYISIYRKKLFCREDLDAYARERGRGRKSRLGERSVETIEVQRLSRTTLQTPRVDNPHRQKPARLT